MTKKIVILFLLLAFPAGLYAGPYTESGIYAYVDENMLPTNPQQDPNALINPIFRGWATACVEYSPADDEWSGDWNQPQKALGPATGNVFDIVSLGDLDENELDAGNPPGQITLTFGDPNDPNNLITSSAITNGNGYDFVVFENAFASLHTTPAGSVTGAMLAELAYVEVSSDGQNFARFPSVSLTESQVGPYGTIEISNVYNLAGKHPNSYSICTGTPFDLDELKNHPLVLDGIIDLNKINFVRIVDIPGRGDFFDTASADAFIDPNTYPDWNIYPDDHPIYDAYLTFGSGGFDLEAIGVLHQQQYSADLNLDGFVDLRDFTMFASAWQSHFGSTNYSLRADLPDSRDLTVDVLDLILFTEQWLQKEDWRQ